MNKKVMNALEAVADEANFQKPVDGVVEIDKGWLDIVLEWAMGQRIHLQYGEEVGLTVHEAEEGDDPDAYEDQPAKGKIVGFAGMDGVLVEVEGFDGPLYYARKDVHTL